MARPTSRTSLSRSIQTGRGLTRNHTPSNGCFSGPFHRCTRSIITWRRGGSGSSSYRASSKSTVPAAAIRQLLVRVHASSLDRGERTLLEEQRAALGAKPVPPRIGGIDAAGEIVELGENVSGFGKGERVAGRCAGGYAEYALLNA